MPSGSPALSISTTAVFKKVLPFAAQHNARVVALSRRDYPGAAPYSPAELDRLAHLAAADGPALTEGVDALLREQARELYD